MNSTLLECINITKEFEKENTRFTVLRDINLTVARGETVCIYGKSGAGKSVLLSLIAGIDRPTSGKLFFENKETNILPSPQLTLLRQNDIGIIFQNFNLISYWTALENVEAVLTNGKNIDGKNHSAEHLLNILGLSHRMKNYPSELSIGEQQRVAVARTLCRNPKLIVADEPTGEVDEATSDIIIDLLMKSNREIGTALIITTHGHFPIERVDTVYGLINGTLVNKQAVNESPTKLFNAVINARR